MSDFEDVGRFHKKFGLPVTTVETAGPREVSTDTLEFRLKFLQEELQEISDEIAAGKIDHPHLFRELIDFVYVALGTAHYLGYPWPVGFAEVQRANLRKVRAAADGSDSKRGSMLDVVKPPGWEPPDIAGVLSRYGWDLTAN